mgnify:CR=1 FL=1
MSDFSHLKNKLLAEQVEDEIYHYILDTPLEPGTKLPNEFELGEKFGVGRSTVREAVKLLSSKGIVEVRRGSGTYVVTTAKGLSDPLNLRSVQDKNALALDLVNRAEKSIMGSGQGAKTKKQVFAAPRAKCPAIIPWAITDEVLDAVIERAFDAMTAALSTKKA